jgi:hypothetical protein
MYRVEAIAANAGGNAVQSTTRTKTSQTWLASQTGAIDLSIRSRCRRPATDVDAVELDLDDDA